MKQNYFSFKGNAIRLCVLAIFLLGGVKTAKACHGVALLNLTGTPVAGGIQVDANSDPATCGCDPYWLQVEVTCDPNGFTGNPPASSSGAWGSMPWFHSNENIANIMADGCILEPYVSILLPYALMCTGTTYYWRAREWVEGSNSAGPWSASQSFLTPGVPPSSILTAVSNQYDVCPGTTVQLTANVSGGCPGATYNYSWSPATGLSNPNIANPTALITGPITYTVTTSGGCFTITSADDTVAISMAPNVTAPTATGNPLAVCSGGSSLIVLTGMGANAIQWQVSPNGTTWFNLAGETNDTLNTGPISSSLYYQAVITGTGWPGTGCGTATSNVIQVTVQPSPTANAGANQTICNGSCATLNGTGGVSYSWQPGNLSGSSVSVCPPSTTTYSLTVTDANGCTGSTTVMVIISNPNVTASPDVSICSGNSTILLATGSIGNTYSWAPAGTLVGANTANPTATPTVTTTYTVTSTNAFGCTDTDSVTVTVTPAAPLSVSNDTAMCAGGTATLNVSGAATYSWQPGNMTGNSVSVTPVSTTTYVITGSTGNCTSTDSIVVTIAPPPNVYAGPDFSICSGTQATLNAGTTGSSYSWQPSSSVVGSSTTQNVTINPTTNTSYTITVTSANGCISTDVVNVSVDPVPNVTATATPAAICVGGSTSLSGGGASSYVWTPTIGVSNPNNATTNANPSNTTTYQVVGTNSFGCTDTATVTVTVNPLPGYYLIAGPSECGDTTGTMSDGGVVTGTGPFTYTIGSNTYNSLPINNLASGTYNVVVTDANGCSSNESVTIGSVNTASVNASASTYFGVYPLTVNFSAVGSPGVNNYVWSTGGNGQNTSYTYTTPGTYTVVVVAYNDNAGCAVYDTLVIEVVEQATIMLPNVFTPNSDGTNDDFAATVSGVKEIEVQIFNRWGVQVYESKISGLSSSPQVVALWDGKGGGSKITADGVYYYIITATGYDENPYPFQGFVQLIKDN